MPVKKLKKAKSAKKIKSAKKSAKKTVAKKANIKTQKVKQKKLSKIKNKKLKKVAPKVKNKKPKKTAIKNKKIKTTKVLERIIAPKEKKAATKNKSGENPIINKKPENTKSTFKIGDYAIYPSHGVGQITDIEKTVVLGQDFSCYLMYFEREKLTIKIPVNSAEKIGLRHLVSKAQMDEVFTILRSGIKKLKGMWSRRAQEYETKINSGDIILLAEVLRDLTRDIEDGERSYSERIIYETAIYRLASEYAVVYNVSFEEAKEKVVITAKDKLNSEGKVTQKDEFDEFDYDSEDSENDEDEENEEEDEEDDEDEDYEEDDYDEEKPKKRARN